MMKRTILLLALFLFAATGFLSAQEYLPGKMKEAGGSVQDIFYDRTQLAINTDVYKSVYKVFSKKKELLYSISITEDRQKPSFVIYIRPENAPSKILTVDYNATLSGLIFSDQGNTDTAYSMAKSYAYLISFADASRDYPILHKIKTDDNKELELDPLSKLRLKKHNELIRGSITKTNGNGTTGKTTPQAPKDNITKMAEQSRNIEQVVKDTFSLHLLRLRDSLYVRNFNYTRAMNKVIRAIQADSAASFKTGKKPSTETRKYKGKKRGGKPDGKGILLVNNRVYQGIFKKGAFVSGKVLIRNDAYEYYGDYSKDTFNGMGWMKYKDGSYQLGIFREGRLFTGVLLSKDPDGDVYFGVLNNMRRTGYAELHDPKGCLYYGDFLEARLVKGYAKEVDRFGYSTYSRIDKGEKKFVEPEVGAKFFENATPKR